ncbi:hypothetical protein CSA56_18880 [candidate division KSB3 bacterium]|uniref:DUF354 domain-containing protein n=1 Tax=candidate division KSB3 bacterium TaxID=2044937 RepID=A0A2G6K6F5_9BACT|nr:MAG: hypothetical protein CSA56_18880 [candidate division KSB3 bacterium]
MVSLNILVEIGHPAHVHFFKNPIKLWQQQGHSVHVVTRDKEFTHELLKEFHIPYTSLSKQQSHIMLQAIELVIRWTKTFLFIKKQRIDVAISISGITSAFPAHFAGIVAITDSDTEDAVLSNAIAFRFSDVVLTPASCFTHIEVPNRITYNAFHELAYLHPAWFAPDKTALRYFDVQEGERYVVIRLVRWKAVHDIHEKGISEHHLEQLLSMLSERGCRVLISTERQLSRQFSPYVVTKHVSNMFDLLAFSSGYIGESPTMAMEAGILGKPSVFISSRASHLGYTAEMEERYGLLHAFQSFETARSFLEDQFFSERLQNAIAKGQEQLQKETVDLSAWVADFTVDYTMKHQARRA